MMDWKITRFRQKVFLLIFPIEKDNQNKSKSIFIGNFWRWIEINLTSNTMGHDFARKCDRQISLRVL
jgi:hypothetical protein